MKENKKFFFIVFIIIFIICTISPAFAGENQLIYVSWKKQSPDKEIVCSSLEGWYYPFNGSCYQRIDVDSIFEDLKQDLQLEIISLEIVDCNENPSVEVCQHQNIWCMSRRNNTISCKKDIVVGSVEEKGLVLKHELIHQIQFQNDPQREWSSVVNEWGAELYSKDVTPYIFETTEGLKKASQTIDFLSQYCTEEDLGKIALAFPRIEIRQYCWYNFETYLLGFGYQ